MKMSYIKKLYKKYKKTFILWLTKVSKYKDIDFISKITAFFQNSSMKVAVVDENYNILQTNSDYNFLNSLLPESKKILKEYTSNFSSNHNANEPIELKTKDKSILLFVTPIIKKGKKHFLFELIDTTKYKNLKTSLVHSQKMQALGQLSGSIAHDFNNLLTAIIGFCDLLLLKHPNGDESNHDLMQIKQNSNRAANLIKQLLAFSRKQVMKPKVMNVTKSITELIDLISRLIENRGINLAINHSKDLLLVKVDQSQFEQVVINLAINARDAMPEGGKLTISTKCARVNKNFDFSGYHIPPGDEFIPMGNYILITVSDTGTGIKREIVHKIFEPFFSTKDELSGTGLGLSTVFGIIKQTGGHIRLKTDENKGTSFAIFLKAVRGDKLKQATFITTNHKEEGDDKLLPHDFSTKNKGKILVVEDEDPVRMFSVFALKNKGYEVIEANCGEQALRIMENEGHNIDLILTDVVMPGITGPKMAEQINDKFPNVQFIFTSGYAKDSISYLSDMKCNFLSKPYSLDDLLSRVAKILAR